MSSYLTSPPPTLVFLDLWLLPVHTSSANGRPAQFLQPISVKNHHINLLTSQVPVSSHQTFTMASSVALDSPALYQVTATSSPEENPDSGLRSWLVTIRVTISGTDCELDQAIVNMEVLATRPELQVTFLGQADLYRAVYAVKELRQINQLLGLPINIMVTPLYHPATVTLYKLDTRLAKLVGRDYLAHPKYALTMVHSYARAHNLYTEKSIICDDTLQQIFGCLGIKLQNIWPRLSGLMKRTEQKKLVLTHQLTEFTKCSEEAVEIKLDQDGNIFPGNWSFSDSRRSRELVTRTHSLNSISKVTKRKSFKRNKSVDI